ncbi:NACHT, LRR and PYD domains-containing protein 12-like [Pempheris klunzingeri]|uniref:NACHT, LRR and PYD domains-containing protein 12-like n=1 Tax=Pempheris klunzingeri TaxID=3127111 RepID=UPI00397F8973
MGQPVNFKEGESADGSMEQQRPGSPALSGVSLRSDRSMGQPVNFKEGESADGSMEQQRPGSPALSGVSLRSDRSMGQPVNFKEGESADGSMEQQRPGSPALSGVSLRSDRSMGQPVNFKEGESADGSMEQQRPGSPALSGVSLRSDRSMGQPVNFKEGESADGSMEQQRPGSPALSGVSLRSDRSMGQPVNFKEGESADGRMESPVVSAVSLRSDRSMGQPVNFKGESVDGRDQEESPIDLEMTCMLLKQNIDTFVSNELKRVQRILSSDYLENEDESEEVLDGEDEEQRRSSREAFLNITLHILKGMKLTKLADSLQTRTLAAEMALCQRKLKSNLKEKFEFVCQGIAKAGSRTPLNQIYTELYITEGRAGEINNEHEVSWIEIASRKPHKPETRIRCKEIFKVQPGTDKPIRTVMTKGVAGIGKTVLTQKFTVDWGENKANQDIKFTFPFTFRELNVLKRKAYSLVELVHHFFPQTKEAGICRFEGLQVVFIFDGLDECRLPLDFHNNETLTDVTEAAPVDVLLTNLIRGNLLPSARLWITSRPAAASQIPAECVDMVTEVRGFTDRQKEEYFRKRFRDEEQADKIISHIRTSRTLHIMCHIPVFCWIIASVLEDVTRQGGELPKTLTEMYILFLVVQSKLKDIKYDGGAETDLSLESREMIKSLGKLAFEQLQKRNLIFYESDLRACGIDIKAASWYSGMLTQIFIEEKGLYEEKVFCFIHLSVQEFLAALHVHLTFVNSGVNLLSEEQSTSHWSEVSGDESTHFHQCAVDKALESSNGHLDLFLRFLLGLSVQTNQERIKGLTRTMNISQTNQETVQYIREKIRENSSAQRSINLFHCLNELNDRSLVEEIQQSLRSGSLSTDKLSPAQWSALVFILLSSEEDLDVFDLKKYSASEEALWRLLPVVKASNKALLSDCKLSERSCGALYSVLSSEASSLRELDLSDNDLQDSGVELLSAGLENPNCRLTSLRLSSCNLSKRSCKDLSSALSSQASSLTELDLSNNNLQNSGGMQLSYGLTTPKCRLKTLRLSGCKLSVKSCIALSSVLNSEASRLTELDLSNNDLQDSVLKLLSAKLERPLGRLEILRLSDCKLSVKSCAVLYLVLKSDGCRLRELDLSNNDLQDQGVKLLCAGLRSPHCRLKTLRLSGCKVSVESCKDLSSALSSETSSLTELDLSHNDQQDSGVELLCAGLESPNCRLKSLRLNGCSLSEKSCKALSAVLSSKACSLRQLDLSNNLLQDSGAELLWSGPENPLCMLESLRLSGCKLSGKGCAAVSAVLSSEASSLTELDLSNNSLQDSGGELLSAGLKSPNCRLKTLRLSSCNLSEKSCKDLSSVLSSEASSLTELDLSHNDLQDSGVELLCAGLESPNCVLESLSLSVCLVTKKGCAALASALSSNPSHLRDLDLSYNHPEDAGVKLLSARLEDPHCRLATLRVDHGGLQRLKPNLRKYACELELDTNTVNHFLKLSDKNRKVRRVTEEQPYPDRPDRFDQRIQLLCRNGVTGRCYWEVDWEGDVDVSVAYRGIQRRGGGDHCVFGRNDRSWALNCSDTGYSVCHNNKKISISTSISSLFLPLILLIGIMFFLLLFLYVFFRPPTLYFNAIPIFEYPNLTHCLLIILPFLFILFIILLISYYYSSSSSSSSSSPVSPRVGVYVDCPAGTLSFYRVSADELVHLHTYSTTFTQPLYPGFSLGPDWFGSSVALCPLKA